MKFLKLKMSKLKIWESRPLRLSMMGGSFFVDGSKTTAKGPDRRQEHGCGGLGRASENLFGILVFLDTYLTLFQAKIDAFFKLHLRLFGCHRRLGVSPSTFWTRVIFDDAQRSGPSSDSDSESRPFHPRFPAIVWSTLGGPDLRRS